MREALVLGGGGFIGSHWYREHAASYDRVHIVDRFDGASHSSLSGYHDLASALRPSDRIFAADAADVQRWPELLRGATDIFVLNADTGTGSSFTHPSRAVDQNLGRLALVIEAIRAHANRERVRVVFTSSRAVYGEGHWTCPEHGPQSPDRSTPALTARRFEPRCGRCHTALVLAASAEQDPLRPLSVYGFTKAAGEQLLNLTLCETGYDVRIVRYQNVYGIGQAIDNPYTGVLNWFSQALTQGAPVKIYEQGLIVRDFIFVSDAADLLQRLASAPRPSGRGPLVVNGGSGVATPLRHAAEVLRGLYGSSSAIIDTDDFRPGDVLGALADTSHARQLTGFEAAVALTEGLARYADWFRSRSAATR